jgi:hypothetical protein
MLIRNEDDGSAIAIGQASHAWLSGQLARAWGNERFGAVEPWEEVCLGAEQHDLGWAMWDIRPTLNPDSGLPYTFIELPIQPKLDLWSGAATRLVSQSRYAALLVSMHGTALYERFPPDAPDDQRLVREFLTQQHALQEKLAVGLDPQQLRRNQKLVFAWDHISLALCLNWAPTKVEDVPTAAQATTLELGEDGELHPWPFREERVELRVEARSLAGSFEDSQPLTLEFSLRPHR